MQQQLRSLALPLPQPAPLHDYALLHDHLLRGISPRLLSFLILAFAPLSGLLHPPSPSPSPSPRLHLLQIFLFFNALALLTCLLGLAVSVTHFLLAHRTPDHRYAPLGLQRKRLAQGLSKTACGLACLVMVCVCLFAAYPFGCLTAAGDSKFLWYAVILPSLICGLLLLELLVFLGRHFAQWWASFMPDRPLWVAIQQHTFFGSMLSRLLSLSKQTHEQERMRPFF